MSKITPYSSNINQNKIVKINGMNNLPKIKRKIIYRKNDQIIKTTKNKKILITEGPPTTIGKGSPSSLISGERSPSPQYYKILAGSPNTSYQVMEAKEYNENIIENENNNFVNNNEKNNIIYKNTDYNNNNFYISKSKYEHRKKITEFKKQNLEYESCSYDIKRTKRKIRYNYNSPERNSKILVKSILCSPISVAFTEIDKSMIKKTYNEYKEEYEETEIIIKNKMKKIWDKENENITECGFAILGEGNYNKNYMIEEYEEKIQELSKTIYNLQNSKNILEEQIEKMKDNINYREFHGLSTQKFNFNFIKDNINRKIPHWDNKILRRQNVNFINVKTKNKIIKIDKPFNIIDYGSSISIFPKIIQNEEKQKLSLGYGDEIFISGKPKFKNKIERIKGFNILRKTKQKIIIKENENNINEKLVLKKNPNSSYIIEKINEIFIPKKEKQLFRWDTFYGQELYILSEKKKNICEIEYLEGLEIIKEHIPKNNNIMEATNEIFIPKKKKELFTWDTFYGQELYILAKKKRKILEIEFLDDFEILTPQKHVNEIEFNDNIDKMPEPKSPFEINFIDEFYIPESKNKLKIPKKPQNTIVYKDKIKLLGKKIGKNIIQKVSLVEIYSYSKPKIIEYEENDYLFIPGLSKELPDNKYIQEEFITEPCDIINLLALEKPKNEKQSIESFDIFRRPRPDNIIDPNNFIFIESTPKKELLEIIFGENLFIEKIQKQENILEKLEGFDILKKEKPLNIIQFNDEIKILSQIKKQIILKPENKDLFTINGIQRPKNKLQRVGELEILKNDKKNIKILQRNESLYILGKEKPKNYIQNTNNINILGIGKPKINLFEIAFTDEMIIDQLKRPNNKVQKTEEIRIIKKPKMKNIKIKTSEFQILKKVKQKNKIQKCDNFNLYSKEKTKIDNNKLDIYFGEEIFIENLLKTENKPQRLKGFNILKKEKPKPQNRVETIEEIKIFPESIKPINTLEYEKNELFTIERNEEPENEMERKSEFELIKELKKQKLFKNDNIIEDTENFQIISVGVRELYLQRLQGFAIFKKEKEPYEMENNYNFIIRREYDALLARMIWNDLYIQKEYFNIPPIHDRTIKLRNENQDDFLIEANSKYSKFKNNLNINDTFTNSRDLSADICRICGGRRINESNNSKINTINKNEIINCKYENVNSINSKIYKTLLAMPKNEIVYVDNIEISQEEINNKNLLSDDEFTRERQIIKHKKKYNQKIYNNKIINKIEDNNINNSFLNNYEMCKYSQISDDVNLNQNENKMCRINKYRERNVIIKKNNYKYNNNTNDNNNFGQSGYKRYTFFRECSNSRSPDINNYQSKSQLTTNIINNKNKRKLFRFEEGKSIKIIYHQ